MAWQRKIPFGYMIRDGLIQPHPQEADAVRYIFGQYLAGASLLTIAEDMTRRGIRYHQHTAEWNKHMVKRILENTKYIGEGSYPRLVADEKFVAAQRRRMEQNTYARSGQFKIKLSVPNAAAGWRGEPAPMGGSAGGVKVRTVGKW